MARQRRAKPIADDRLDWRDPDMPVLRSRVKDGQVSIVQIPTWFITKHSSEQIEAYGELHYYEDESYYWNRKRKK